MTAIVDRALGRAPGDAVSDRDDEDGRQMITMSRADLERIRTLAWWARDAAARIGQ